MIYLDNGATTFPKPECVYEAMDDYARHSCVNAGRGAYKLAREAGAMIRRVRSRLTAMIGADPEEEVCLLTPSVTAALNEIIGGFPFTEKSNVYVSPYEHNSVLRPLEMLRKRIGFKLMELPLVRGSLAIDLDRTAEMFAENPPSFTAVTCVSNVTGYILPAGEIFRLARRSGSFCLLDAAQGFGLVPISWQDLGADAVTFAGHKTLYASFGAGGAVLRRDARLGLVMAGGTGSMSESLEMPFDLPDRLESGSKDTLALASLDASLEWLKSHDTWAKEHALTAYLLDRLAEVPGITIYAAPGALDGDLSHQGPVVSFNLDRFAANEAAALLDDRFDIAVRAGHHCAAFVHRHLRDTIFDGTVRVSLGYFNSREDIDALAEGLKTLDPAQLEGISEDILRSHC